MVNKNQTFFNQKVLNGWNLWALISLPISLAVVVMMTTKDLSRPDDISSMIQFSVRCSVPWLYLAFAIEYSSCSDSSALNNTRHCTELLSSVTGRSLQSLLLSIEIRGQSIFLSVTNGL